MFDGKKTLAVFSHPNHEIAVYGLLRRARPRVVFLTDGGGGDRLAQTGDGLRAAGIFSTRISYFGSTEEAFYRAILEKNAAFFHIAAARLADIIKEEAPGQILCDGVEYYNPIHDIALPIVLLATRKADTSAPVFAVPLVYQAAGSPESYVFQRSLPEQRSREQSVSLEEEEGRVKRAVLKSVYTALTQQMGFPAEVVDQCCRVERVVVPAASPLAPVDPHCVIRYDRRGDEARRAGQVDKAITYEGHFLPLVRELLA
jgi:hypothetical protein